MASLAGRPIFVSESVQFGPFGSARGHKMVACTFGPGGQPNSAIPISEKRSMPSHPQPHDASPRMRTRPPLCSPVAGRSPSSHPPPPPSGGSRAAAHCTYARKPPRRLPPHLSKDGGIGVEAPHGRVGEEGRRHWAAAASEKTRGKEAHPGSDKAWAAMGKGDAGEGGRRQWGKGMPEKVVAEARVYRQEEDVVRVALAASYNCLDLAMGGAAAVGMRFAGGRGLGSDGWGLREGGGGRSWVLGRCMVGEGGRRERVVVRNGLQVGQVGGGASARTCDVSGPTQTWSKSGTEMGRARTTCLFG
jgi:hypothetical protein